MKSQYLSAADGGTHLLVLETGDELPGELLGFAAEAALSAASFVAIGAFQQATLGFFDLEKKEYLEIPVDEQSEVLSLAGNVTLHDGEPKVHAHVVLGLRDGSTRGGHLLHAVVRPTLEISLRETPSVVRRRIDEATGLPLIDAGG